MISWPAVFKYADDPELDYYEDLEALEKEMLQTHLTNLAGGYLLDSNGEVYTVSAIHNGKPELLGTGRSKTLEQVLGLVKAHAAHADHCCVAKLWAPTIPEALQIIHSIYLESR